MRALLDINVVIALLDAEQVMHTQATQWLARELDNGWASCPVTQNGVLRILSQPAYPNHRPAAEVAERLAQACSHPSHQFWSDSKPLQNKNTCTIMRRIRRTCSGHVIRVRLVTARAAQTVARSCRPDSGHRRPVDQSDRPVQLL